MSGTQPSIPTSC
ncbi:hypothetical protein MAR_013779 [Mya arenaria]|uniref:Uncharacterized protein n=1 Tax=Mya arenaria TaxID=6604 RepID=A0ABY7F9J8_MYAAR|nr:hypothetical protein MAR_021808 [Mya arenaria]WAR18845.1 hypothetical protein MAR_000683 [Mya arenaria]WAR28075.1 hypothetical protein MAR_013779 [Mya arenaria]